MSNTLEGKRLKLIQMDDPFPIEPESEGTIFHVDSMGTLHVKWDNGRFLGVVPKVDKYEIIETENETI